MNFWWVKIEALAWFHNHALGIFKAIDVFSMSSCIATSRLVHNGGYIQKLLQLFSPSEILWFVWAYLVTKVLLNIDRFYSILAVIQDCKLWKCTIIYSIIFQDDNRVAPILEIKEG